MADASLDQELRDAIGEFDFPVALVRLSDLKVVAVSGAFAAHLGVPASSLVDKKTDQLLHPQDRPASHIAVEAVRNGEVESYHAHRRILAAESAEGLGSEWIRAFEIDGEKFLVVEADPGTETHPRPLAAYLGRDPAGMVIGWVEPDWVIKSISTEITDAIGLAPSDTVGQRLTDLVSPGDAARLKRAAHLAKGAVAVCLSVHLTKATTEWHDCACLLACMTRPDDKEEFLGFALLRLEPPPAAAESRTAMLERHLWNIAAEVESSGILDNVGKTHLMQLPKMQLLTVRQWEIVSRLLRGERVAQIAKELFVSQSTIRNHLSQVFERFGVHSQAELIEHLRKETT